MLFCILGLYVYFPACLIFSNVFLLCLIVFCCQIDHICISWFFAGCCRCRFLDLKDFLWTYFRFCCFRRPFVVSTLLLASCFAWLQLFLMFVLTCFVLTFFALEISGLNKFALVRFRFAWRRCLFFFVLLACHHPYRTARLFLPLYSSTWSPLVHHDNPCRLPVFSLCVQTFKNMSCSPVFCSFYLVFAPPRVSTPYFTHPNRSASIFTHFWPFSPNRPKHDVRGNFPGHRVQILTCTPINTPRLPCFCIPRASCDPTHPSAPIHTHLYLFSPVYTQYFMYICII